MPHSKGTSFHADFFHISSMIQMFVNSAAFWPRICIRCARASEWDYVCLEPGYRKQQAPRHQGTQSGMKLCSGGPCLGVRTCPSERNSRPELFFTTSQTRGIFPSKDILKIPIDDRTQPVYTPGTFRSPHQRPRLQVCSPGS